MGFYLKIFTTNHIGARKYANEFLEIIESYGVQMKKIGFSEPIKQLYSREKAIEYWIKEEPGCYNFETDKLEGTAGGVMGKGEGFWFDILWWQCPKEVKTNVITIYFTQKTFKKMKYEEYINLFKDLIKSFDALYGYFGTENAVKRQRTGHIIDRIPGVFWCNYYNSVFTNYLNSEDKLFNFPWFHIEKVNTGGTFSMLTEKPIDKEIEKKEKEVQEYLGTEKFNGRAKDYPVLS